MRDIREEEPVRLARDQAEIQWERAFDAWEIITWAIVRDPEIGRPFDESGHIRTAVFDGARSAQMPSIEIVYTIEPDTIVIEYARFYEAPYHYAGHG